ncbi:MAG: hypothetical protein OEV42_16180 [Deltaproteobacteria bacterium]|nr:hypothetical protein [Deltaproteobacteria bacterium]
MKHINNEAEIQRVKENSYSKEKRYFLYSLQEALRKAILILYDMDFFITYQNVNALSGDWVCDLNIPPAITHGTCSKKAT